MEENKTKFKNDTLVEVWGDVIAVKELLLSIAISVTLGMTAYLIAPDNSSAKLLFSIGGIVIATIINSLLFKPKRVITISERPAEEEEEN